MADKKPSPDPTTNLEPEKLSVDKLHVQETTAPDTKAETTPTEGDGPRSVEPAPVSEKVAVDVESSSPWDSKADQIPEPVVTFKTWIVCTVS